jgi:hypothetical protein
MTPQERQLVDDLFDRLAQLEKAPRDPDAIAAITDGLRKAPSAVYALVQTVLLQDEALKRANAHIQELEQAPAPEQTQSGGFLDSMRDTIFGPSGQRGSVPNVPPPSSRPVWNSGQVLQQAQPYDHGPYDQGPSGQGPYGQGSYGQGSYGQAYGAPQPPFGGGGSFLGTAAAAAAGMVGGSLLLNGIRSMMGGSHQAFGNTAVGEDRAASPWSDQSGSTLARDAGINDIGHTGNQANDTSRAGLLDDQALNDQALNDQASNDPSPDDDSDDHDDMDADSDDFGGNGDSDYA